MENYEPKKFHVDGSVTNDQLKQRLADVAGNINGSFRQLVANGSFTFGFVKLHNPDLNRVHSIVNEIDRRRIFYLCGEDEVAHYAMQSLYAARDEIRELSRGVWADPSCEKIIQSIAEEIDQTRTKGEKAGFNDDKSYFCSASERWDIMANMRLRVWYLVALLKRKTGRVTQPQHLPEEIWEKAQEANI